MTSWKPEFIADDSGKWAGNALRFATREEAEVYAADLALRWTLVRETRAVETDEPVTARLEGRILLLLGLPEVRLDLDRADA